MVRIPRPAIELLERSVIRDVARQISPYIGRVGFIMVCPETSATARLIVVGSFVECSEGFLQIVVETILIGFDEDWLDNKSLVDRMEMNDLHLSIISLSLHGVLAGNIKSQCAEHPQS
jgi:hypothetical protein